MKTVRMSLIGKAGEIANEWVVPYPRRHVALDHALDRAEQEGHAGVLWCVMDNGKIDAFSFESHDPEAIVRFMLGTQLYTGPNGLNVDKLLGRGERGRGN